MARSLRRSIAPIVSGAYRGVCLSGMEFGSLPGIEGAEYTKFSNNHYSYIASKGMKVVRLAVLWERLQPNLNDVLNATYKGYIDENISWAKNNGLQIILDIHNYGRRKVSGVTQIIGDGVLTKEHLTDLWSKLSVAYKDEPGVLAYDLMNEPYTMPVAASPSTYKTTATVTLFTQACIDAIRANGDSKIIIIPVDYWSNMSNFLTSWAYTTNADKWWTDSLMDRIWIGLHKYFDTNSAGTYGGVGKHQAGMLSAIDSQGDALSVVGDWSRLKNVPIFMGEYGIPIWDNAWLTVLNDFMNVMDEYKMHGTYWAMGHWFSSQTGCHPKQNYTEDQVQMDILVKHI